MTRRILRSSRPRGHPTLSVCAVVVSVVLAAAAPPAQTQGLNYDPPEQGCFPKGSKTIQQTAKARVYGRYRAGYGETDVWACAYRSVESFLLGSRQPIDDGGDVVDRVQLGGIFVAWNAERYDHDGSSPDLEILNLITGRTIFIWPRPSSSYPDGANVDVTALVISRRGSAAWIASGGSMYTVWTRPHHAAAAVVDSGPAIGPRSLKLHRGRLTWKDGRMTRTATLR
jgi:hypothetical protein